MDKKLSSQKKELETDISNLDKKLQYLETTYKNSRVHIDQILQTGSQGR
jgi:prefoldin subunit 1